MASDSISSAPPPKKIKIAACVHCKAAKRACDEQKPCTRCTQRGLQCCEASSLGSSSSPPLPVDEHASAQLKQLLQIVDEQSKIISNLQFLNNQYYQHIEYLYEQMNKSGLSINNAGGPGAMLPPEVMQNMMLMQGVQPAAPYLQVLSPPLAPTYATTPVVAQPLNSLTFTQLSAATTPVSAGQFSNSPRQRAASLEQTCTTATPPAFYSPTTATSLGVDRERKRSLSCNYLPDTLASSIGAPMTPSVPAQQFKPQPQLHRGDSSSQVVPSPVLSPTSSPSRPVHNMPQGSPCSLWNLATKTLVGCNASFQGMMGYTIDELMNEFTCVQFAPPRLRACTSDLFSTLFNLNTASPVEIKTILMRKDGTEISTITTVVINTSNKCAMMKHIVIEDELLSKQEVLPFATPIGTLAYDMGEAINAIPSLNFAPLQHNNTYQPIYSTQPSKNIVGDLERLLYTESP